MEKTKATKKKVQAKTSKKDADKEANWGSGGRKKKVHRFRPGTVALREIKKYQKSTDLLIPRSQFIRFVRDICIQPKLMERVGVDAGATLKFSGPALYSIQEIVEMRTAQILYDAQLCAIHAKRVTVFAKDLLLARKIRGEERDIVFSETAIKNP